MQISMFILPLIFVVLGVLLRFGKASFLICGYNTSSKQEKEKYDEKALCNFAGNLLFVLAGILLLTAVAEGFNPDYLAHIKVIAATLIVLLAIVAAIYANTGNRFKKQ